MNRGREIARQGFVRQGLDRQGLSSFRAVLQRIPSHLRPSLFGSD